MLIGWSENNIFTNPITCPFTVEYIHQILYCFWQLEYFEFQQYLYPFLYYVEQATTIFHLNYFNWKEVQESKKYYIKRKLRTSQIKKKKYSKLNWGRGKLCLQYPMSAQINLGLKCLGYPHSRTSLWVWVRGLSNSIGYQTKTKDAQRAGWHMARHGTCLYSMGLNRT